MAFASRNALGGRPAGRIHGAVASVRRPPRPRTRAQAVGPAGNGAQKENGAEQSSVRSPFASDGPQESFVDISSVLKEAKEISDDFVFSDDSDEPVWELEGKLTADPVELMDGLQEVQRALDPEAVDITSAYSPEQGFKEVDATELSEKLGDGRFHIVVDVRRPMEYADGHVPGATNIPLDTLSDAVKDGRLDEYKNRPVAVICEGGSRSAQATVRLSKVFGFKDVSNVKGGTKQWIERGFPLE